jgi:hypothetical protein
MMAIAPGGIGDAFGAGMLRGQGSGRDRFDETLRHAWLALAITVPHTPAPLMCRTVDAGTSPA